MSIKLIASDLDGTLLTDKKEISEMTYKALEEAAKRGIHFVPATGRSFSAVPKEILELPNTEYVITSNGAAVYSVSKGVRIYECILEEASVDAILRADKPVDMAMEIFVEGIPYSEKKYVENPKQYGATDYGEIYVKKTRHAVEDIYRFARENKSRIDSVDFAGGAPTVREKFRDRLLAEIPDIYITSSISHLLEIGNINAGKGRTLEKVLKLLRISPEEAMSFGDADNDIPMLTSVKYGVAMGNGAESCKEIAFAVTDTNERDGVAKAILKMLETL